MKHLKRDQRRKQRDQFERPVRPVADAQLFQTFFSFPIALRVTLR